MTNYSPPSQNIPPVQKIPAKIESPPTLVFAGFLYVIQAFLPVLPILDEVQAVMPESPRIAGRSGSGMVFETGWMFSPSIAQD